VRPCNRTVCGVGVPKFLFLVISWNDPFLSMNSLSCIRIRNRVERNLCRHSRRHQGHSPLQLLHLLHLLLIPKMRFCLRRMAFFGSPKFDRRPTLHILSADSRVPDLEPGQQLAAGNHSLAVFPRQRIKSKRRRLRGGGDDNYYSYYWNTARNKIYDNRERRPLRRLAEDNNDVDNDVDEEGGGNRIVLVLEAMVEFGIASNRRLAFHATYCIGRVVGSSGGWKQGDREIIGCHQELDRDAGRQRFGSGSVPYRPRGDKDDVVLGLSFTSVLYMHDAIHH
jgi:hypothetical protein